MSQKEKFALYLTPEMKARLERRYTDDGSRSLTGFIENAINFYLDYLSANNAGLFLPSSVQSYLDGRLNQFEDRMASLLYKQSVELDMGMSVLADCVKLDEAYLRKKRAETRAAGRCGFFPPQTRTNSALDSAAHVRYNVPCCKEKNNRNS